jgi:hypothetical protein
MESDTEELPPDLQGFIDQLIVPLLVAQMLTEGHLYRADDSYYDDETLAPAA